WWTGKELTERQIPRARKSAMNETRKTYGLLSETSTIEETRSVRWQRNLPADAGLQWLRAGWRDLRIQPGQSLAYGAGVLILSAVLIGLLIAYGRDYIIFPALAGFMIVAPLL